MNQLKKINEDLDKEKIRLSEEIKKLKSIPSKWKYNYKQGSCTIEIKEMCAIIHPI